MKTNGIKRKDFNKEYGDFKFSIENITVKNFLTVNPKKTADGNETTWATDLKGLKTNILKECLEECHSIPSRDLLKQLMLDALLDEKYGLRWVNYSQTTGTNGTSNDTPNSQS